jgi:predicted permease
LKLFLPASLIPPQGFALDGRVLLFTLAASLLTSLFCGALPALVTRKVDLRSSLAASSRSIAGGSGRLRQVLIVAEVAMTVVLVAGAGLLVRTLAHLEALPPGFDAHNVMTAKVSLDDARYRDASAFQSLLVKSIASMKRIPGVEDAAMGLSLPYERGLNLGVDIMEGKQAGQIYGSSIAYVTPEYFSTLRMPFVDGRSIREDDSAQSERVAVVNESFARKFFGETNVVGRHIRLHMGGKESTPNITIVGVVSDVAKAQGIHPTAPLGTEPVFYVPATQFPADALAVAHLWFQPSWIVRTQGPVSGLTAAMEHAMSEADPNLPVSGFYSMNDLMRQELQTQRVEVLLLSTLAGLALLLSAIGIYALVSNLVEQRRREIGIRMALGSSIEQAMVHIGLSGIVAASGGLALGAVLSIFALRVLKSEVYGIGVYDPVAMMAAPGLLAVIAIAASLLPSLRISRIDPAETLRSE